MLMEQSSVSDKRYSSEGAEVVVCGKFNTYKEGSQTFVHQVDSSLQLA